MTPETSRPVRFHLARWLVPLTVVSVLLLTRGALAAGDDVKDHPGYVEGSQFVQLIDPHGRLIEVNMDRKLLKLFTVRANKRHESVLGGILSDLVAINAVIGDVTKNRERVAEEMQRIRSNIERGGWERFVRVREEDHDFSAYIHADEDDEEMIDGLVVIGFEEDGDEMVFVNLAGRIDMERIALLGERMGLPGLDDLPPMSEVERQRDAKKDDKDGGTEEPGKDEEGHVARSGPE